MNKIITYVLLAILAFLGITVTTPIDENLSGLFTDSRTQGTVVASSTAFTFSAGFASKIIAPTSTPPGGRVALKLQTNNCVDGGTVYYNFLDKVPATSTVGHLVSSSTITFGDNNPMVYGTIRAMSAYAACTLLVTEYRTIN